jgi:hypothetical protein
MSKMHPITAPFDALPSGPEKLWGLRSIARAIGLSEDTTRLLARKPGVPIYQPPGATSRSGPS